MAQQRGRPQAEQLVEALRSVVELLPAADRGSVRAAAWPLRSLANATTRCLNVSTPQAFQSLGASQLLKRFPRASSLDACLSSCGDVKALCLFFLTSQSDQSGPWTDISLAENRSSVQQQHQYMLGGSGYGGHEPAYQRESRYHYGHGGSGRGSGQPASLDATEALLAAVCSCSGLRSISIDKTTLLETEAAALSRMRGLEVLRLSTNSSAQPLRRPLVQLMLSNAPNLRVLKLSYIRDTTADLATSLARLPNLQQLTLQYAYWGESGAGERVMAALARHQKQLQELRLYECCASDEMLDLIMGVTGLRRLHIQDEDAPEESCPTNKGLVRLTQLKRLEQLELFGEELQLDAELLALLARLPALRRLAMAGLDALRAENMDTSAGLAPGQAAALGAGLQCGLDLREAGVEMGAGAGGAGGAGVPGRPAAGMGVGQPDGEGTEGDADMTTSTGDEESDDDCTSGTSLDDVTSRPQHALAAAAAAAARPYHAHAAPRPQAQLPPHPAQPEPEQQASAGAPTGSACVSGAASAGCSVPMRSGGAAVSRRGISTRPARGTPAGATAATAPAAAAAAPPAPAALYTLPQVDTLRLYGQSSTSDVNPPLALLLPQPRLRNLKLSASASHGNLRALCRQPGLHKLIVSHTSVAQLYPPRVLHAQLQAHHEALQQQQYMAMAAAAGQGHVQLHHQHQHQQTQQQLAPATCSGAGAAGAVCIVRQGSNEHECCTGAAAGAEGMGEAGAEEGTAAAAAVASEPPPAPALPPMSAAAALAASGSILGFHNEVRVGLRSLRVLRIKDLPGFMDGHLGDLAEALKGLPELRELKLRALSLVSDAGVATLAGVTQLRLLKLYALGDGVTELGVAHTAACLPHLGELKVKDCARVGPSLRETVAACINLHHQQQLQQQQQHGRSSNSGIGLLGQQQYQQQQQLRTVVVRYGAQECSRGRPVAARDSTA